MPNNPYNRTDIAPGRWVVLCRADRREDGSLGRYELATSDGFETLPDAMWYRDSIHPSREPLIALVGGR